MNTDHENFSSLAQIKNLIITPNKNLQLDKLPPNLEYLYVKRSNQPNIFIESMKLPKTMKKIKLETRVRNENICELLINGINNIRFSHNEIIDELPLTVTKLKLSLKFKNHIDYLPKNLRKLTLNMEYFEHRINYLPESLEILKIKCELKHKLKFLPSNLKTLILTNFAKFDHLKDRLPQSLIKLVLPLRYTGKIPELPNLKKLACNNIECYNSLTSNLTHLRIYKHLRIYITMANDSDEDEEIQLVVNNIILPIYVEISVKLLNHCLIHNVKKLILKNCQPDFYQLFDIDTVSIHSAPGKRCSKLYNTFAKGDISIIKIVLIKGKVTKCMVVSEDCNGEIEFFSEIKSIYIFDCAKIIKCPNTLINFTLCIYMIEPNFTTVIELSPNTKSFFVDGFVGVDDNFKIIFPIIPNNMIYCNNSFLSTFVPAKFIE